MAARVTPKENFMKLRHGGTPYYVPTYTMMGFGYKDEVADTIMSPPLWNSTQFQDGGYDMWGVKYVAAEGTANATMPDTSIILLEDICDWSKVIKFPTANEVDFEKAYQAGLEQMHVDRNRTAVKVGPGFMPFQTLVALMGFEGGLCALYTDPDEVKAMLNAMVDLLEPYFEKTLDVYQPDWWYVLDDTAAKETPFFSPEIYKDVFLPIYHRLTDCATRRGIPVCFHNCGKIGEFVPMMIDFGVELEEPSQESNDLMALKAQYPGKISFAGGWDWAPHMPADYPNYDEEVIRQGVRDTIDKNAKGGAYAFSGGVVSYAGDPVAMEIQKIIMDEAYYYGRKVYDYPVD